MKNGNITIELTEKEAVTMGQLVMEAISKRTYEPDNVNVKWLWAFMAILSKQIIDDGEEE